jgi:uracil-DNA glycosylase family 4
MNPVFSGNYDAKYMFVGETLGGEEDQHRRPLVGASGQEFYPMLEESHWIPHGTAKEIVRSLHPYYNQELHRMSISNPNFLPLDKTLDRSSIFITNVCHVRPPNNEIDRFFATKTEAKRDRIPLVNGRYPTQPIQDGIEQLRRDIETIRPIIIIALGGTALWALTGLEGITKWRGSILTVVEGPVGNYGIKLIPTFHPADILREWPHRFIAVRDLKRAYIERQWPEVRAKPKHYIIRPSYAETMEWLDEQSRPERAEELLGADIETPWGWWHLTGHIACMGFATSRSDAICIPLMCVGDKEGYWPPDEEVEIVLALRRLMTTRPLFFHKSVFDVMHIIRHWGFMPRLTDDTMVMQHVRFPGLFGAGKTDPVTGKVDKKGSSLSLVFCASMYCEYYRAWKDEGKNWNQKEIPDEDGWWSYNCDDTTNMYEVLEILRDALYKENLWTQYRFMMSLSGPVFDMMLRGFPIDQNLLKQFKTSVRSDIQDLQFWINEACGHEMNTGSSTQLKKFFYNDLEVKKVMKGRGKDARPTLDTGALEVIARRYPTLGPLCYTMRDERHLSHFDENTLSVRLSDDGCAETEISITGTESMRFTSTKSCFGTGLNLQNLNRMPEE